MIHKNSSFLFILYIERMLKYNTILYSSVSLLKYI